MEVIELKNTAGGKGQPTLDIEKAVEFMLEKYEVVQQFFNEIAKTQSDIAAEEPDAYYANSFRFNYKRFFKVEAKEKLSIILQAEEHILGLEKGKTRFMTQLR